MEIERALQQLESLQKKLYAYHCADSSLYLDAVTTAPSDTSEGRGVAMSILAGESQKLMTSPETKALLDELSARAGELDLVHRREVEELRRSCEQLTRIPADEYMAYKELCNRADDVWHKAKAQDDFALFCPVLQELVDYNRRFAGYYDASKAPYDALLNEYERGVDRKMLDSFFATLREGLVPLIQKNRREAADRRQLPASGVPGNTAEGLRRLSDGSDGPRPQPLWSGRDGAPLHAGIQQ